MVILFVRIVTFTAHQIPLFPHDGGKVCIAGHMSVDAGHIEFVDEWGSEVINLISTNDKHLMIAGGDLQCLFYTLDNGGSWNPIIMLSRDDDGGAFWQ